MDSPHHDEALSGALQAWRLRPQRNSQFRPAVWARIRRHSRDSWANYVRTHRVAWTVAAALVVGVAGWTGQIAARARLAAERDAMVVAYLVELDPRVQANLRH